MFQLHAILLGLILGLAHVNAHFLLNYPATVGFGDDQEGTAPCGGFPVTFTNVTNFYVGGDSIALTSLHPASTWLFRATLDTSAGGNWSILLPAVAQMTQGQFCEQSVMVPTSFAGSKGVIQVIEDAVDGQLFQCGAVNFVSGVNPSTPSACVNATGLSAAFTTDAALSNIAGATATAASGSSAAGTAGSSTTSSAASPSPSKSASAPAMSACAIGSLFWGMAIGIGSLIAASGL